MHPFDYSRVSSVDEAAAALAGSDEAKLLAGGMSLIPVLRQRLATVGKLVDLNGIPALREIHVTDNRVCIGAMATHYAVSTSPEVKRVIPALVTLAGGIGDPLVRNRGTIGGSLANNDPAACYPSALLGLGGSVRTNRRVIHGDNYIRGMFETALGRGEIIVAVEFPRPDRAAYIKFENFASRFSIVGIFVSRTGGNVRVGVTGAGPHAFRARTFEEALARDFRPEAVRDLRVPPSELLSDIHAAADYRSHLITELVGCAVARCLAV